MSSPVETPVGPYGLTEAQYDEAINTALRRIELQVDRWLEDDVIGLDVRKQDGDGGDVDWR